MGQFLESAAIALQSIWANKLRSFLTVLGNIVAVTSIIAVVSLIRGMDTYVASAIVGEVGADTFRVERIGFVTDEEEAERAWRRNPIYAAKQAATLDQLTDGRLILGVGLGSKATYASNEFDVFGVPFSKRAPLTDEYIEAMKRIARQRGQLLGTEYAEAFLQYKPHSYPANDLLGELFGRTPVEMV